MTAEAAPARASGPTSLRRVALAGLAGGAVDLVYASCVGLFVLRIGFLRVWQGVAAGWMGPAAREAGWATAALGIVTHFGIAMVMAGAYALVGRRRPLLYDRWAVGGAIYGLILYGVMFGVVLPLRFGRPYTWRGALSVGEIAAHVAVGLAIAFVLSRDRRRAG